MSAKFLSFIFTVCIALALSSCKKEDPALIKPAQSLKTVSADCTMFQWAKQIHGTGTKSAHSSVVDEWGATYIAGTITDQVAADLDPGHCSILCSWTD